MRSLLGKFPRAESLGRRLLLIAQTVRRSGGVHPRECPICEYSGYFTAHGSPPRWDARCPKCGVLERHRLLALALRENPNLIRGDVVHFAPEIGVSRLAKNLASTYRSADISRPADLKLNIEQIDLPDESVDTFLCSHILEHVDDRKALKELYRCLRPGGAVIISTPVIEGWQQTYENSEPANGKARDLHFGQSDHIRYYGSDIRRRIEEAGFSLSEYVTSGEDCARYGIIRGSAQFFAVKRWPR